MNKIKLSGEVMISDPCYSIGTWCQTKVSNVLPGTYLANANRQDLGEWGQRIMSLVVIHEDYVGKNKRWYALSDIGVDSGQAGIFDMASYRNDAIAEEIESPEIDFVLPIRQDGDDWYTKMCKFTLGGKGWGSYDGGIVSSSGMGDGMYAVYVLKDKKKIVGISIDFGITDTQKEFLESLVVSS